MPTRHLALAAAVAVIWGVNFVVIHVGLDTFPPLLFAALRFTLVALPAVLLIRRPPIAWRWIVGVGAFLSAGQFGLLFVGMDQGMPAGLSSLVLQLQAVFTIGLGMALLGERPHGAQLAGAGVALGGIAVIGAGRAEAIPMLAFLLCVGAALSWGIGNVCVRRAQSPDPIGLLVWSSLVPPLPLLGLSLVLEGPREIGDAFAGLDAGGIGALLYVVVLSTFFGFGVWTWLIREHAVSKVAPFTLLVPPAGIGSAWLLLGERPAGTEIAGALIVLAGLALITGALRAPAPPLIAQPSSGT